MLSSCRCFVGNVYLAFQVAALAGRPVIRPSGGNPFSQLQGGGDLAGAEVAQAAKGEPICVRLPPRGQSGAGW